MMKYKLTIGLEIHAQLRTKTKMFCSSLNDPEEKIPNINICPICTSQPGTLPVINKKAVEMVIRAGLALTCKIATKTWFDRKSYFYPDLPKGYQISQYKNPLCLGGKLKVGNRDIKITRIHLEEDTGRLIHSKIGNSSLVDLNRAGIPLMELVTEPDIHSAKEARLFCEELRLILKYLQISNANMEKGEMRCEANISLSPTTSSKLGTKVEIKNLNSFRAVERAINYETKRQTKLLESKKEIVHETRGWNENKQITFSQRTKETSDDYRYFIEPDLPPLFISTKEVAMIKSKITELPSERRERFKKEYKISKDDIEILTRHKELGDYFENVVSELKTMTNQSDKSVKLVVNYLVTETKKYLSSLDKIRDIKITPESFAKFITLVSQNKISSSGAQLVLAEMFKTGASPSHIIKEKKLSQISNESRLLEIISRVIKNNSQPVSDYRKGNENILQFLVGQVMKLSRGSANPEIASKLLKKSLTK